MLLEEFYKNKLDWREFMYILTFILVFALSQFVTNKLLKVSDESSISYTYPKRDGLIIFGFIAIGILLQVFAKFTGKTFWIIFLLSVQKAALSTFFRLTTGFRPPLATG